MTLNADIELLRTIDLAALPVKFDSTEFLVELNASIESHCPRNGELSMRYEIPERMHNGFGVVHGGIISAVLDQTMINALFLTDDELDESPTISMSICFIESLTSGSAIVTARPVFVGNRVAQLSAECFNGTENRSLVATATSSTLLRRVDILNHTEV